MVWRKGCSGSADPSLLDVRLSIRNLKLTNMSPIEAIESSLSKFGTFSGRASRSEFWWFSLSVNLWTFLLQVAAVFLGVATNYSGLSVAFYFLAAGLILIAIVPQLSVGARRLHDIGRSGWWQLLSLTGIGVILLLVWFCFAGDPRDNEFGTRQN